MKEIAVGPVRIRRVEELPATPVDSNLMFANATPELFARGREWLDSRFIRRYASSSPIASRRITCPLARSNILRSSRAWRIV